MYEPGTILLKRKQRDPIEAGVNPTTGDPVFQEFPYNRVEVIGQSPVIHGDSDEYKGADAAGVLLKGLSNFGATLDEPYGRVKKLYEVESVPEYEEEVTVTVKKINATSAQAGKTPEEVFAAAAPSEAPLGEPIGYKTEDDGTKTPIYRTRTPIVDPNAGSPLAADDPKPVGPQSVLAEDDEPVEPQPVVVKAPASVLDDGDDD